jgi:acetylornithine deacetylase
MRAAPTGPLVERWDETLAAAGLDPAPAAVRYATDAARLQTLAPCLVWGPGDIAQAHGREEWIDVDALGRAARLLRDFLCTEG